jgi:hypothetical protein
MTDSTKLGNKRFAGDEKILFPCLIGFQNGKSAILVDSYHSIRRKLKEWDTDTLEFVGVPCCAARE